MRLRYIAVSNVVAGTSVVTGAAFLPESVSDGAAGLGYRTLNGDIPVSRCNIMPVPVDNISATL